MKANVATALALVYGWCPASVCACYPITPLRLPSRKPFKVLLQVAGRRKTGKNKLRIVQAEDELASYRTSSPGRGGTRAARLHRDLRARHLADDRVHRPRRTSPRSR